MTNKKEILISRLRGSVQPLVDLPDEIAKYDIYDDTGHVDLPFMTAVLQWMKDFMTLQTRVQLALNHLLGIDDLPEDKKKKQSSEGAKWSAAEILRHCRLEDNILKLPDVQFNKKSYADAKQWILEAGGQWQGGKVQGFTFPFNAERVFSILHSGQRCNLQQEFQYFATPAALADRLVEKCPELADDFAVLEPSAGTGAIIDAVHRVCSTIIVDYYELMPENRELLEKKGGIRYMGEDFLKSDDKKYDAIFANPPFSNNQDVHHVMAMYDRLKPGGLLATITSCHWEFAEEQTCKDFRRWLDDVGAEVEDIPEGMFKASGTTIKTKMITVRRYF